MKRLHLIVSGRVQGVAFRANTQQQANNIGLTGWVKNLSDGSVEIVAEGDLAKIAVFENWCRLGPSTARVDQVKRQESQATGEFTGFSIHY